MLIILYKYLLNVKKNVSIKLRKKLSFIIDNRYKITLIRLRRDNKHYKYNIL